MMLRGILGWAKPACCPKTIQRAFWKAEMTTSSFSILGSWACLWRECVQISTALYLPNNTWTNETSCFPRILQYFSKSFFTNLRGSDFIKSEDETLEHRTTTKKWIQAAAPIPHHPACMLLIGGRRNSSQLSTFHFQWRRTDNMHSRKTSPGKRVAFGTNKA